MMIFYDGRLTIGDMPTDQQGNPALSGEALRIALIDTAKHLAGLRIAETGVSWMVEREMTGGAPVPQECKDTCASIREWSNQIEVELNAAANDAELLAVDLTRPSG